MENEKCDKKSIKPAEIAATDIKKIKLKNTKNNLDVNKKRTKMGMAFLRQVLFHAIDPSVKQREKRQVHAVQTQAGVDGSCVVVTLQG